MSLTATLTPVLQRQVATKFARAVSTVTDRLDRTVPVDTGRLKRSKRVQFSGSGTTILSAMIEYGPEYGKFLDEGIRPHWIERRSPNPRATLRFQGRSGVVFRRRVFWKPGPRANALRGWFSRPTSAADWRLTLSRVFGG